MNVKRLLVISRPLFWFLTGSSYLLGIGGIHNITFLSVIEFLFFTFPLNLYLYGLNDVSDTASDRINPRKGDIQGAVVSNLETKILKRLVFIPAVLFIVITLFSLNWQHILCGLIFLFFAFAYSHKTIRLKEKPIIDSITSTIIYMSPALIAYTLHKSVFQLSPINALFVIPTIGIHALTTLKDRECDKRVGINTIGVFFGETKTLLFCLLTFFIPFYFTFTRPLLFLSSITAIIWLLVLLLTKAKYNSEFIFAISTTLMSLWVIVMMYGFFVESAR